MDRHSDTKDLEHDQQSTTTSLYYNSIRIDFHLLSLMLSLEKVVGNVCAIVLD